MARKTIEEKMSESREAIRKIEKRIEADKERLSEEKKQLKNLETEAAMGVLASFNVSPQELKKILQQHESNTDRQEYISNQFEQKN